MPSDLIDVNVIEMVIMKRSARVSLVILKDAWSMCTSGVLTVRSTCFILAYHPRRTICGIASDEPTRSLLNVYLISN